MFAVVLSFLNLPEVETLMLLTQAVAQRCSGKKLFWKISQYSVENTYVGVSFIYHLRMAPSVINIFNNLI